MKNSGNLVVILSSIGALNGIIFALFLLFKKNSKTLSKRILGVLIFAISLRVGKSVLMTSFNAPKIIVYLGLLSFMAIGPLLYFYLRSLFQTDFKFHKGHTFHLLPLILFVITCFIKTPRLSTFYLYRYYFIIIYLVWYILFSWFLYRKERKNSQNGKQNLLLSFTRNLIIGITMVWGAYYLSFTVSTFFYLLGPVLYSFIFYIMIFWIFNHENLQSTLDQKRKYQGSTLKEEDAQQYHHALIQKVEQEKLYLDPNLSLIKLAKMLSILPLHLSQIINERCGKNFTDFINSYRLTEAKKKLSSKEYKHLTIMSIAQECGFNSISSFNTAFKKQNHCSPSQLRSNFN